MNTFLKAAVLGTMAGMRSMSAPSTMTDYIAKKSPGGYDRFAIDWLFTPQSTMLWRALAIGEMGGDKAPGAPPRIDPAPLGARAISGGISAGSICAAEGKPAAIGAAIGVAAAVASSFGFYHLRRLAAAKSKVPDAAFGAVEDAIVVGLRRLVLD